MQFESAKSFLAKPNWAQPPPQPTPGMQPPPPPGPPPPQPTPGIQPLPPLAHRRRSGRPGCCLPRHSARRRRSHHQAHRRRGPSTAVAPRWTTESWSSLLWWWWARPYRPAAANRKQEHGRAEDQGCRCSNARLHLQSPISSRGPRGTRDETVRNALSASGIRLVETTGRGSAERSSQPCTRVRRR